MLHCNIVVFNHQRNFILKKGRIYVSKQLGFALDQGTPLVGTSLPFSEVDISTFLRLLD
jgi:hypothetical protein